MYSKPNWAIQGFLRRISQPRLFRAPHFFSPHKNNPLRAFPRCAAFTLIELLVVIAIISILASLLLPVLVMAKTKAQGTYCLSSFNQMQLAWLMYNHDNSDFLAPNSDNGNQGQDLENLAWVAGKMTFGTSPPEIDEDTNTVYMVGPQFEAFGSLGPYTKNPKIYHCPGDRSAVTFNGSSYDRVRSLSMNGWVGFNTRDWMQPSSGSLYKVNFKMGDLVNPGPSMTWVFIDEREDSINDGWFAVDMVNRGPNSMWVDIPASRHNHGSSLSFADGHCESKKWMDPRTNPPLAPGSTFSHSLYCPDNADISWLQQRTTGTQ
jgi:prepilin-type N-terminal cleavage/methylation domain-containing protein/prepilin-type processing-associated H-X9-DG protein